jgi:large subunit ribosomal protein L1
MAQSKRIRNFLKNNEIQNQYTLEQAVNLIKEYSKTSSVKFPESVDAQVVLGVDPTKGDQVVKSTVSLPHGTGRTVRVIVFAEGDDIKKALSAGATHAGSDDLIDKVKNGFMDFDKCIATSGMMKKLVPLAKILGPRGLMPNPKLGTVTDDVTNTVKAFIAGRLEYRTGKDPIVRVSVGRTTFEAEKIIENIKALVNSIKQAKPATVKGQYIVMLRLSATMSGFNLKVPVSMI